MSNCSAGACSNHQLEPCALADSARGVLEHLVRLQRPLNVKQWVDADQVFHGMLLEARVARGQLRQLITPALRSLRQRAFAGDLSRDFQLATQLYANRGEMPLLALFDEARQNKAVTKTVAQLGVRAGLITELRAIVKASGITVNVQAGAVRLTFGQQVSTVIDDTSVPVAGGESNLLDLIGRSWARVGRLAATLVPQGAGSNGPARDIGLARALAGGIVFAQWFLDREVRDLEDTHGLPAVEGNEAVGAVVVVVAVAIGIILHLIADKVDDPVLADVLRVIGTILILVGVGVAAVDDSIALPVCTTDPATGVERCTTI